MAGSASPTCPHGGQRRRGSRCPCRHIRLLSRDCQPAITMPVPRATKRSRRLPMNHARSTLLLFTALALAPLSLAAADVVTPNANLKSRGHPFDPAGAGGPGGGLHEIQAADVGGLQSGKARVGFGA